MKWQSFLLLLFDRRLCHFEAQEISSSNSTKIGDSLYGTTCGDFSYLEMTKKE
jgi:hypothetical protein